MKNEQENAKFTNLAQEIKELQNEYSTLQNHYNNISTEVNNLEKTVSKIRNEESLKEKTELISRVKAYEIQRERLITRLNQLMKQSELFSVVTEEGNNVLSENKNFFF